MRFSTPLLAVGLAQLVATGALADGTATDTTLYYTTFSGAPRVFSVQVQYDGASTLNLLNDIGIATTPGADGIVLNPNNGQLLVGGQGSAIYQVDPATGTFATANPTVSTFHLAVDPNKQIVWASSIPGTLAFAPIDPFGANGTAVNVHTATGETVAITSLAFVPHENCPTCYEGAYDVYYTNGGSGGFGTYGSLDMTDPANIIATPILTNVPAAHGMVYDPFSDTLILGGSNHITQIVPGTTTIVGDLTISGMNFDQGAVDGEGHIFFASNTGNMLFLDYSLTQDIDTNGFLATPFLRANLDDIAPLIGAGGTNETPEPATIALLALAAGALAYARRRRS